MNTSKIVGQFFVMCEKGFWMFTLTCAFSDVSICQCLCIWRITRSFFGKKRKMGNFLHALLKLNLSTHFKMLRFVWKRINTSRSSKLKYFLFFSFHQSFCCLIKFTNASLLDEKIWIRVEYVGFLHQSFSTSHVGFSFFLTSSVNFLLSFFRPLLIC